MRLRITFSKAGALRYTGHLDLQRLWERTIRRADLPLAYTLGFHPGPKIQLAAALSLGVLGRAEIVDIWLREDMEWQQEKSASMLQERLQLAAPGGLKISCVERVDENSPALQTRVTASEYEVELLVPIDAGEIKEKVKTLLASSTLLRDRRGKQYDLRPLIEGMEVESSMRNEHVFLKMRLAAREAATGRADEVLAELGIAPESARVERLRIILNSDNQ